MNDLKPRGVSIDEPCEDPGNARRHDDRNVAAIARSFERFGAGRLEYFAAPAAPVCHRRRVERPGAAQEGSAHAGQRERLEERARPLLEPSPISPRLGSVASTSRWRRHRLDGDYRRTPGFQREPYDFLKELGLFDVCPDP